VKSSYRLLFGDKEPGQTSRRLKAAIVDNTTGEDWTSVRLSWYRASDFVSSRSCMSRDM